MGFPRKKVNTSTSFFKWRTILGLVLVWLAAWFNWQWAWGLLFLIWVVPDLFGGVTYFMEPIYKTENPILYWLIVISWILMSVLLIASAFFPKLLYGS